VAVSEQPTVECTSVVDLCAAMQQLDGDAELLQEIVEIFVETAPEQLQGIAGAIDSGDVDQVALVAHGMKGGASNFCAGRFVESARALEMLAKGGSLDGARALFLQMESDFSDLAEVAAVINWLEVQRGWTA